MKEECKFKVGDKVIRDNYDIEKGTVVKIHTDSGGYHYLELDCSPLNEGFYGERVFRLLTPLEELL